MGSFVRKVKTASGATAVQIVHKRGKQRLGIDHIGSAHDQAELELLLQVARERLAAGQDELELGWEPAGRGRHREGRTAGVPVTVSTDPGVRVRSTADALVLLVQPASGRGSAGILRTAPGGVVDLSGDRGPSKLEEPGELKLSQPEQLGKDIHVHM